MLLKDGVEPGTKASSVHPWRSPSTGIRSQPAWIMSRRSRRMGGISGAAAPAPWRAASSRRSPCKALAHRCGNRSGKAQLAPRLAAVRHEGDTREPHRGQVIRQVWNQTRRTALEKPASTPGRLAAWMTLLHGPVRVASGGELM